ncbi:MAG: hypothetical protein ABI351_02420 [Herbaspirillum sp.]
MRILKSVILMAVVGLLAACATQRQQVERVAFDEQEYSHLLVKGTGEIDGQAFLTTNAGDVKKAAGKVVLLSPAASQTEQWYRELCVAGKQFVGGVNSRDPRYQKFIKETVADADGKFSFHHLGAGAYYLTTSVYWKTYTPGPYFPSTQLNGAVLYKKVAVKDGDKLHVVLSARDVCPGWVSR